MRNRDVVKLFLKHLSADSDNLHSNGKKLFSYSTCIAQWIGSRLIGNKTKYSTTSSKHLNYVKPFINIWTNKDVPRSETDLLNYIPENSLNYE